MSAPFPHFAPVTVPACGDASVGDQPSPVSPLADLEREVAA